MPISEIEKLSMQLKARILSSKLSPIAELETKSQEKLGLSLVQIVSDPLSSSLWHWGNNDDPTPGMLEQLVSEIYNLSSEFKHRQLLVGLVNELKDHRLYVCINYVQRTIFISRI